MAGKYRAYPEYKGSKVDWLGDVPSHWNTSSLKYLSQFSGGGTPSKDKPEYWNGDIPWVSPKDMKSARIVSTIDHVTERAVQESSTSLLEPGALLLVVRSGILQHSIPVAINDVVVTLNQDMKALRFNRRLSVKFAMYVVLGNQRQLLMEWSKQGATVESIEQEYLANTVFPVPRIDEQKQVCDFLDHETAKIDTLIEKQQQLIKLLQEKRQAVISHAVTKGLNPDVPMRDSGVEWLGDVPGHWVCSALKNYSRVIDCKHITAEFLDVGIPVASIGEVKSWFVDLSAAKLTSEKYYLDLINGDRKPRSGDIIYSRNATVGEAALVADGMPDFAMGQDVCLIRLDLSLLAEYVLYLLKSGVIFQQLDLAMVGSTFKRINVDDIRNFKIALPPREEQAVIVEELTRVLERYDTLVAGAQSAINLIQERRTALISAAVTGKIDVRDWQPLDSRLRGNDGEVRGNDEAA